MFLTTLLYSCEKKETNLNPSDSYYVTPNMARMLIANFEETASRNAKTESEKEIIAFNAVTDSVGQNTIYTNGSFNPSSFSFNYKTGLVKNIHP